jgi:hypothetical protein
MDNNLDTLRGLIETNLKGTYGLMFDEFADEMLVELNTNNSDSNRIPLLMHRVHDGQWQVASSLPKTIANIAHRNSNDTSVSFRALTGLQPRHKQKGTMAHYEQSPRHTHKLPGHLWVRERANDAEWKLFRVLVFLATEEEGEVPSRAFMLGQQLEPGVVEDFVDDDGFDSDGSDNDIRLPLLFAPPFRRFKLDGELALIDVSTFVHCKQAWVVGASWRNSQSQDDTERRVVHELQLWIAEQWVTEPNM